jgi:hypothetical protein
MAKESTAAVSVASEVRELLPVKTSQIQIDRRDHARHHQHDG